MPLPTDRILSMFRRYRVPKAMAGRYLELLTYYEGLLFQSVSGSSSSTKKKGPARVSEARFQESVSKVLNHLCSLGTPFWYQSACLWLIREHQDRGTLLIPSSRANFDNPREFEVGVDAPGSPLGPSNGLKAISNDVTVVHNEKGPSAFVPLFDRAAKLAGVIALYSRNSKSVPSAEDAAFLRSLGSLISNAKQQSDLYFVSSAQHEMDLLLQCNSLQELWARTAKIMLKYLSARGCMVIYRPEPTRSTMVIVAEEGFTSTIRKNRYQSGRGQTGKCAQTGLPIRWDDVSSHIGEFDAQLLKVLEKAHRSPIHSWMAIPIGTADKNYGVIKFVNRKSGWFTSEDERLASSLAVRLRVSIERFRNMEEMSIAIEEVQRQSEAVQQQAEIASLHRREAEHFARERQEDLMIITHQLQSPLLSLLGAISSMRQRSLSRDVQEHLEVIMALAEDSFLLCFGTSMTFALEAGREGKFYAQDINAPEQLRALSRRLQRTNNRPDLTFRFREEHAFPTLRMSRDIFVSVMYSLLHNALKYADLHSEVLLECSFERFDREPALKIKSYGEPIQPSEVEMIFEKFKRGRTVELGRHHRGSGLGLWVARGLMRAIGGDLTLELSAMDPRLSIFIVHLPTGNYG